MCNRKQRQRGSAMIEFTLVGIPMIFLLISIFEMSRAMWNYHTLAFAIREGTRYAVVHGSGCSTDPRNSCQATVAQVAQRIQDAGIGLDAVRAYTHVHLERKYHQVHIEHVPRDSDKLARSAQEHTGKRDRD